MITNITLETDIPSVKPTVATRIKVSTKMGLDNVSKSQSNYNF